MRLALPIAVTLFGLVITVLHYTRYNALTKGRGKIILILFFLFLVSLLPVLTLETSFLGNIQGDRYGYFPSFFFVLFIGIALRPVWPKLFLSIGILLVGLSAYLTVQTNKHWIEAKNIRNAFLNEISTLEEEKQFILLNAPDNYEGVYLFRHGLEQSIDPAIYQKMIVAYSHAITRNQQIRLKEGNDEITLEFNEILTEYQDQLPGLSSLQLNEGTCLSIELDSIAHRTIYYFDKKELKAIKLPQH